MQKYIEHKGVLFHPYEWSGGFKPTHKEVVKAQAARRRELARGEAHLVDGD